MPRTTKARLSAINRLPTNSRPSIRRNITFSKVASHFKKEIPACLIISTVIWAIKIAADWQGFYPITWAIVIIATALFMYLTVCVAAVSALKFLWSLIKRIPIRRSPETREQ